jgi:hypothetical protein
LSLLGKMRLLSPVDFDSKANFCWRSQYDERATRHGDAP